ncbi:DUF4333 domain-containing protein [Streptomyces spongiae]|uniref:DUF4333 domain-containing protein n=1 Tax=Streptomyces spongiae TaxID=565072 RepID=A0A5N8XYS9_9ACTN|nr:DUF4333 domain-containing protein [Streptomyces spongiae]MPY64519.1 DUF4333 domain-containing protein [Streptomyces spongiae]
MQRKYLVPVVGTAVAVIAGGVVLTLTLGGTESTTELDSQSSVTVDGEKALSGNVVGGRTQSKYHALPWLGTSVKDVRCPDLKAVAGAKVTCTAKDGDGEAVSIPVSVVDAEGSSVTWKFER